MPAKKNSQLQKQRINKLLNRISQLDSLREESSVRIDLGKSDQPLAVSLESFIQFNFDLSQELDHFIEEKMLDEYQKEWNEWGALESDRDSLDPTTRLDLPSHPK